MERFASLTQTSHFVHAKCSCSGICEMVILLSVAGGQGIDSSRRLPGSLSPVLGGDGWGEGEGSASLEEAWSSCTDAVSPPLTQPSPPSTGGGTEIPADT